MPKKQSEYQVCLKFSPKAKKKFNSNLYRGEQCTVLWRAEDEARAMFERYGNNWEEKKGMLGTSLYPTISKAVEFHHRFGGLEESTIVFYIDDVTWRSKPCRDTEEKSISSSIKERLLSSLVVIKAVSMLVTIILEYVGINKK